MNKLFKLFHYSDTLGSVVGSRWNS